MRAAPPRTVMTRAMVGIFVAFYAVVALGCRTAVITEPKDDATQTIVTVERRPATQPADKGLIIRER